MSTTVTNQTELDAAIKAGSTDIIINSPAGVWLTLNSPQSSSVEARGSSSVVAWGSSRVVARESSSVVARGSSSVVAWESSRVEARGSSSVVARESSRVEARESSSVVARESSRVEARGSSSVVARESSSVEAWESSRVEARESSSVEASRFVAVHLFSKRVTLTGSGVVIDVTELDTTKPADWLDWHGVKVTDGKAIVYKAVDQALTAGQSYTLTKYPIGKKVTAKDWKATQACGYGLHFAPSAADTRTYFNGSGEPRFLAVEIDAEAFIALNDKCKAQSCTVLYEVDIHGDKIEPAAVKA
jgi:hypothetical protein